MKKKIQRLPDIYFFEPEFFKNEKLENEWLPSQSGQENGKGPVLIANVEKNLDNAEDEKMDIAESRAEKPSDTAKSDDEDAGAEQQRFFPDSLWTSAHFISRMHYWFMRPFIKMSNWAKHGLDFDDIPNYYDASGQVDQESDQMLEYWNKNPNKSVLRMIYTVFYEKIWKSLLFGVAFILMRCFRSVALGEVLAANHHETAEAESETTHEGTTEGTTSEGSTEHSSGGADYTLSTEGHRLLFEVTRNVSKLAVRLLNSAASGDTSSSGSYVISTDPTSSSTDHASSHEASTSTKAGWIVALLISIVICFYCEHIFFYYTQRQGILTRISINSLVFKKLLQFDLRFFNKEENKGKILNFLNNDVMALENGFSYLMMWGLYPIFVIVVFIILIYEVGIFGALAAIGIVFLTIPIQYWFMTRFVRNLSARNSLTDKRIYLVTEMMENIKYIKMGVMEDFFYNKFKEQLSKEDTYSSWNSLFLALFTAIGASIIFFATYIAVLVHHYLDNYTSNPEAFTVLSLFMDMGFINYCVLNGLDSIRVFERLGEILNTPSQPSAIPLPDSQGGGNNTFNGSSNPAPNSELQLWESNRVERYDGVHPIVIRNFIAQWSQPKPADSGEPASPENQPINSNDEEGAPNFKLDIKELLIKQGTLTLVIGPNDGGKSSLLLSLMKELPYTLQGENKVFGKLAVTEQDPVVFQGTIKENILFGNTYHEKKYFDVLRATTLLQDMKGFPEGDMTQVGNRGKNLSTGQRAKVCIARALYSNAEVFIFDDPFANLDPKMSKKIFKMCIKGMLAKKTVIMSSKQPYLFPKADHIVIMIEGKIRVQGTFKDVQATSIDLVKFNDNTKNMNLFKNLNSIKKFVNNIYKRLGKPPINFLLNSVKRQVELDEKGEAAGDAGGNTGGGNAAAESEDHNIDFDGGSSGSEESDEEEDYRKMMKSFYMRSTIHDKNKMKTKHEEVHHSKSLHHKEEAGEHSKEGGHHEHEEEEEEFEITWDSLATTFKLYYPWLNCIAIFIFSGGTETLMVYFAETLAEYTEEAYPDQLHHRTHFFFETAMFQVGYFFCASLKCWIILNFVHKLCSNLQLTLIQELFRRRALYFDRISLGMIINHFSNDVPLLLGMTSRLTMELIEKLAMTISTGVVICMTTPFIIIPAVIMMIPVWKVRVYVSKGLSIAKSLDLKSKAKISTFINLSANGIVTIRAYNKSGVFSRTFTNLIEENANAAISQNGTARFLGFWVDLIANVFAIFGILVSLILTNTSNELLGVILLYLLALCSSMQWSVRNQAEVEDSLSSLEKVIHTLKEHDNENDEAQKHGHEDEIEHGDHGHGQAHHRQQSHQNNHFEDDGSWPQNGEILIKNLSIGFSPTKSLISNINLKIESGHKVGIVGKSGAGKSTLMSVLLRVVEPTNRTHNPQIMLAGKNILDLPLSLVRKKIDIMMPQPFIYSGSVRENLDPFNHYANDEESIWEVLRKVKLDDDIKDLNMPISNRGSALTLGQKQMLCLGRVLLNKSKMLILDEATSNLDSATELLFFQVIERDCKDTTIISISHKISTLMDVDRILVIDSGKIVEYDHPFSLLVSNVHTDTQVTKNGYFAQLILSHNEEAPVMFEAARKAYHRIDVETIKEKLFNELRRIVRHKMKV